MGLLPLTDSDQINDTTEECWYGSYKVLQKRVKSFLESCLGNSSFQENGRSKIEYLVTVKMKICVVESDRTPLLGLKFY